MMKKFVIAVCGSIVGTFIAATVLVLCGIVVSFGMLLSMQKAATQSVQDKSILHITLQGTITEVPSGESSAMMSMLTGHEAPVSLSDITKAIQVAKTNDKVKGILLDCGGLEAGTATLSQIRQAVVNFKRECPKKWVYAYGPGYDQADYYVASAADSIFINPLGSVDLHGLASIIPYPKKALDKLGVRMLVLRVGSFKSAVEPFLIDSISPENRLQTQTYLNNLWGVITSKIAQGRDMKQNQVNALADAMIDTQVADSLKQMKVVDALVYEHQMEDKLKALTGIDEDDDLRLVEPDLLAQSYDYGKAKDGKIAVVYAVGEIDPESSPMSANQQHIDSEDLIDQILELKDDDDVKGMVLRVNSPGGSFYGSEQIWEALEEFKKAHKTLTVSMGDYAASGGYYISSGAQRIFADSTTITGSIGIYGAVPVIDKLLIGTLGINISTVKTNQNSDRDANFRGLLVRMPTPAQQAAMQRSVNNGYELFTKRCAMGRHMSQDSIKAIAQGRVWDGISAQKIGLVDEFGGLQAAIDWTARKAGLNNGYYEVEEYTMTDDSMQGMLRYMGTQSTAAQLQQQMGIFYTAWQQLQGIMGRDHVLCLMPDFIIR